MYPALPSIAGGRRLGGSVGGSGGQWGAVAGSCLQHSRLSQVGGGWAGQSVGLVFSGVSSWLVSPALPSVAGGRRLCGSVGGSGGQ